MIEKERIKILSQKQNSGKSHYVIYWMQASQRVEYNHALFYAIEMANSLSLPLIVYFQIVPTFPEANVRHFSFMLEGLQEVQNSLQEMDIPFIVSIDSPENNSQLIQLAAKAKTIITDCGYLKFQKKWRKKVAAQISCPLFQIESDVIVPVETASAKEEYAARTLRPKLLKKMDFFLKPLPLIQLKNQLKSFDFPTESLSDIDAILEKLNIDTSVNKSPFFSGGNNAANKKLRNFIEEKLPTYFELSGDPGKQNVSDLSPYLHFGQISPLQITLEILHSRPAYSEKFLEQLIIRRELSINFVHYNPHYDSLQSLPNWSRKTLEEHQSDKREYLYSLSELEHADTHDKFWNAAQMEMVISGKMHNYMRMYWGKKVIEWTSSPQEAYRILLYLNNKYELDGRDANGYTSIAWCFGKHDQGWKERPIFGKIRYMNAAGLRRKFDMETYTDRVRKMEQSAHIF